MDGYFPNVVVVMSPNMHNAHVLVETYTFTRNDTTQCRVGIACIWLAGLRDSLWWKVSSKAKAAVMTAATADIKFTFKTDWNWLAVAGFLSFQVLLLDENLRRYVSGEATNYYEVLFDALIIRDDFLVANYAVENLLQSMYSSWIKWPSELYIIRFPLLEPGAANSKTITHGKFLNHLEWVSRWLRPWQQHTAADHRHFL